LLTFPPQANSRKWAAFRDPISCLSSLDIYLIPLPTPTVLHTAATEHFRDPNLTKSLVWPPQPVRPESRFSSPVPPIFSLPGHAASHLVPVPHCQSLCQLFAAPRLLSLLPHLFGWLLAPRSVFSAEHLTRVC
jgi:hypothetical protein